jgi:hypothetical protein
MPFLAAAIPTSPALATVASAYGVIVTPRSTASTAAVENVSNATCCAIGLRRPESLPDFFVSTLNEAGNRRNHSRAGPYRLMADDERRNDLDQ